MFETRRLSSKIILQVILTVMVLPFLFPLVAMVQESLAGQGWENYKVVWDTGVVPGADAGGPGRGGLRRPAHVGRGPAAADHGGPAAGADGGHGHPHGPAGPRGRDGQPGGAGHLPGHPVEHRGTATKRS